jgi:spoIIIJ-associated protein
MSYTIEKTGKTVEEAVSLALLELDAGEDDVYIEVLEEGSKGIFGLLGNKQARVKVTMKETGLDIAVDFLEDVFDKMDVDANIEANEQEDGILIRITGKDSAIIIGKRGETLDSLQYLTSLVVNRNEKTYKRVTIDIENYRKKREETLVKLANRLAERVVRYRKNITLEPMNPYERRIIHSTLQNNKHVETYSIGDDPNRKVIITLRHAAGNRR